MKKTTQVWIIGLIIIVAAVLAFLLQDLIKLFLLDPLVAVWWDAGQLYRSLPQMVYWIALILVVLIIAVISLLGWRGAGKKRRSRDIQARGPIEDLAWWMENKTRGEYFKWYVASYLARLLQKISARKSSNETLREPIGVDPDLPDPIRTYFVGGMIRYERPERAGFFQSTPPSPFDIDIEQVIDYIESKMELQSGRKKN